MVTGTTTKRSPDLDADYLTAELRSHAVAHLASAPSDELWLIADGSDLRKPYAKALPNLMKVRSLSGGLVPGYQTLTVLGLILQHRGILYHRLFSSTADDFVSEPYEVQTALQTVSRAIAPLKAKMPVTWLLDSGFDDVAIWRTIWEQNEHVVVVRVYHTDRRVRSCDCWRARTMLEVQKRGQPRAKRQAVTTEIWACPLQVSYETNVRRSGPGTSVTKTV